MSEQIVKVRQWNGKMPVSEMAERLGTSVSNIKRAFIGTGEKLWFKNGKYINQPELVQSVLSYYSEYGKNRTVKRFPQVNVKCITDRPEYYGFEKPKRQIRWTDEQIIEAAKMAGLVSYRAQAKFFNRPGAHAGSIKAIWQKRFGMGDGQINGLVKFYARPLILGGHSKYIRPVGQDRIGNPVKFRSIILWVDLERILKPEVPEFIRDAIHTMANFQRWLWQDKNPKSKILKMIKERENLSS